MDGLRLMARRGGTARHFIDLGIPRICRALQAARERRGLNMTELAERARIDPWTVRKFEDPQRFGEPQLAAFCKLAGTLGLRLDGLFAVPATAVPIPPGTADPIGWILQQRGWTMHQLGEQAGLSHNTIPQVASGKARADLLTCEAIARAAGVSLDSLAAALLAGEK